MSNSTLLNNPSALLDYSSTLLDYHSTLLANHSTLLDYPSALLDYSSSLDIWYPHHLRLNNLLVLDWHYSSDLSWRSNMCFNGWECFLYDILSDLLLDLDSFSFMTYLDDSRWVLDLNDFWIVHNLNLPVLNNYFRCRSWSLDIDRDFLMDDIWWGWGKSDFNRDHIML